jgi:oxazoline/thiazoline dehydrogenase
VTLLLKLAPTSRFAESEGGFEVATPRRRLKWTSCTAEELDLVRRLAGADQGPADLSAMLSRPDDPMTSARLHYLVNQLDQLGALSRTIAVNGAPVAALHPCDGFTGVGPGIERRRNYRLSRFAYLRSENRHWIVSCPLGHARLQIISQSLLPLIGALGNGADVESLASSCGAPAELVGSVMEFALWSGALTPEDASGVIEEERSEPLRQWEFHDLLFHAQSRIGRHQGHFGGTFRFRGEIRELPALPRAIGHEIMLPIPDADRLRSTDRGLTATLAARRSEREFGSRAVTIAELGELLFRVAHLKEARRKDDLEIAFYNYPGGGARSELVFYVVVGHCDGMAPGLYRYEAERHAATPVCELDSGSMQLLENARRTLQSKEPPPLLILLAARFQRVSWKYVSMAYSVILKDVGGVLQTLYLVATAMGLSACALGGGDSDLFAKTVGNDYYAETSVGEFAFGSSREADA